MATPQENAATNNEENPNVSFPNKGVSAPTEVFRVGVKVPPFWPERPALWFAQLEGQFLLSGISNDTTKFYTTCGNLEHKYAVEVADIIENPPKERKYETLKSELIRRLTAPREEKIKQFLMSEDIGTRKPSQFLRHLQHLAGPNIPEEFIRTTWYNRLPVSVQPIIASQGDMPLDKLAELADKITAIAQPTLQVAAATPGSSSTPASDSMWSAMEAMARQIEQLTKQVAELSTHQSRQPRRRFDRQRYRSRSRSQSRSNGMCYYHNKFGNKAFKCTRPCSFTGNADGSQ
ncbi:uncharacterized protein LOC121731318 [Aricia agestis]|uniref:uncharacterized protein LOC121731318 n=1 Tax=Aricia agestis TaxID=91739 RepID=UPI001C2058BF|nr:uncharacterized protein LOC121731318 [Aricia agestis]